jgi:TolA-binding protein
LLYFNLKVTAGGETADMVSPKTRPNLQVFALFTVSLFLSTSCVATSSRNDATVKPDLSDKAKYELLSKEYRTLIKEFEKLSKNGCPQQRELEDKVTDLNKRLAEKNQEIEKLAGMTFVLQTELDEAIQEVVRAKAKLRSLESRAETATSIAETEIALKTLTMQYPDRASNPSFVQAEQLLAMSSEEFKKKNYSGALYLVNQVKDHISKAENTIGGGKTNQALLGEVPFAKPLKLRATKKSNVREGPGLYFSVVSIVKPETPLTGYSFKGQWLRVKGDNGVGGWIFQDLVRGR